MSEPIFLVDEDLIALGRALQAIYPGQVHICGKRARHDQKLANAILQSEGLGVNPPAFEWAIVIAFYAAVHYANAIIWERPRRDRGGYFLNTLRSRNRTLAGRSARRRIR